MKNTRAITRPILSVLLAILATAVVSAGDGGLSPADVAALQDSFHMDARTRVAYNSVTNGDIKNLALNRDIVRQNNGHYSHKIKTKGVTDEKGLLALLRIAKMEEMFPMKTRVSLRKVSRSEAGTGGIPGFRK